MRIYCRVCGAEYGAEELDDSLDVAREWRKKGCEALGYRHEGRGSAQPGVYQRHSEAIEAYAAELTYGE